MRRQVFSYRRVGKVCRRIRRLVGPRVFNNARTATRNLDLPLAIDDPIATHLFLLHKRILASAWRPQRRTFCTAETGSALGDLIISWYFALPQGLPRTGNIWIIYWLTPASHGRRTDA